MGSEQEKETCRNIKGILGPRSPGFALQISSILNDHTLKFISNPIAKVDKQIDLLLEDMCKISRADITRLYLMDPNLNQLSLARQACIDELKDQLPGGEPINEPNWFFDQAKECGVIYLNENDKDAPPEEAAQITRALKTLRCRNFLGIPVYYEGEPRGLVTISRNDTTVWSLDHLDALEQIAQIIYHVWLRKIAQVHEPVERETRELYVERWKSFLEHSPDTIAVIDSEGRISDINRTVLVPKQEILGQPIFNFLPPSEHEGTHVRLGVVFEDHQSVIYETQSQRDDGSMRWYCNRISPLFRNDDVVSALLVSTDITERKVAESSLLAALASKSAENGGVKVLENLAGAIAQNLNNLFWIIDGNLELIRKSEDLAQASERRLDDVNGAVTRAEILVEQLVQFSQHHEGERVPTSLVKTVSKAASRFREVFPGNTEIPINIENEEIPFIVNADPRQLEQVCFALFKNANEAMPDSGAIEITIQPQGESQVRLSVKDSGHGISSEVLPHIFEPFFTTKGIHQGVGLGLSTVQGIITSSGGQIEIKSKQTHGTEAIITLPLCDQPLTSADTAPPNEPIRGTHLLVVDNEESVTGLLHDQLSTLGYKVTASTKPSEAVDLFQARPGQYSLAIVDQALPGLSGAQLAQELHAIEPHLPIILVAAYSSEITRTAIGDFGIRRCLLKPIALDKLNSVIGEVLDSAQ